MDNIERLKSVLDLSLYGKGQAKDFESLITEINQGESVIIWEGNKPIRLLQVCRVRVLCGEQELYEDRQQFADGRTRKRGIRGLAEKLMPDEAPEVAAVRALKEELGIVEEVPIIPDGTQQEEKESPSYPGLLSRYIFHDFIAQLPPHLHQDEYVEGCNDDVKRTYFTWKTK